MYEQLSYRDRLFDELTREFPQVPVRVMLNVFLCFVDRGYPTRRAIDATRDRIVDACAVPA